MSCVLVEFLLDKTQLVVSSDDVRDFSGVVEDDKVYQVYWAGDARTKVSFYDAKVPYMAGLVSIYNMALSASGVVKVIFHEWLPYQRTIYWNGNPALGGPSGMILDAIAQTMNVTFDASPVSHNSYGIRLPNGTWTGMVGSLQKGEADAIFSIMVASYARSQVIRLGPTMYYGNFAILSGSAAAGFDAFEYLQAFDIMTWLMLLISLVVLAFLISLPDWGKPREEGDRRSSLNQRIQENAWRLFASFLYESCPHTYARTTQRILVGVWLTTVVVLANSFASLLKSQHAVGNFVPEVDSIMDVAARPHLRPIIVAGTYYEHYDRGSSSPYVKKVWEMSRKKKGMIPPNSAYSEDNLRQVAERRAVLALDSGSVLLNMALFCELENVRNFYIAKQPIEETRFVYSFSKHLDRRIYEEICNKIKMLFEGGLVQKWIEDSLGNWKHCVQKGSGSEMRNIGLDDAASWFILWAIVLCCASIVFFLEIWCAGLAKRNKK